MRKQLLSFAFIAVASAPGKSFGLETLAVTAQADKKKEILALGANDVVVGGDEPGAALRDAGGVDVGP